MGNQDMRYTIQRFQQLDSTNTAAARMAEDGAPGGTVVVAEEQSAGRGRHGRQWSSPPGTGLYLSVVLRPPQQQELWQFGFAVSLAVADAIGRVTGTDPRTKWPNDVLINGRKVCGILIEAKLDHSHTPTPPHSHTVVVGIGINVNTPGFPPDIASKATSLAIETGRTIDLGEVESALLDSLDARYEQLLCEGFQAILGSWRDIDCTVGREVSVEAPDGTVHGVAQGVNSGGDLIVRQADGSIAHVTAGDVMLR